MNSETSTDAPSNTAHYLVPLGLAFILISSLYISAFELPFFFDDLDHIPYVTGTTLLEIWQSAGGFPYFRPLGATVWRLSYLLLGEHNASVLHALNVYTHALNSILVGLLSQQLLPVKKGSHVAAGIAAICFGIYPFSYQAVPWIGAYYHILVTTLVLIALLSHGRYTTTGRKRWIALSLTAATLAPFAHENGILILPLVLLITLIHPSPQSPLQNLKSKIPWLLPPLIWLPIWLAAPKARTNNFSLNNLETIWQNTAYYLQGFAFPITWTGGYLRDTFGWNDLWTAVTLSLLALTLATLILSTQHSALSTLYSLLLPITLFFIAAAPAILLLPFAYNISAPRLQMLPSIGAAILWSKVMMTASTIKWPRFNTVASWAITFIWLGLVMVSSWSFVYRHMQQHEMLGFFWRSAANLAVQTSPPPIFINAPSSMAGQTTWFPLGHEGTVFLVPYIPPERMVEVNADKTADFAFRRQNDIRPEMDYIYDVLGDDRDWPQLLEAYPEATIYNTVYHPRTIELMPVGRVEAREQIDKWQVQSADYDLKLLNSLVSTNTFRGTQTIDIALYWHTAEPLPWEWTIFVHILDESGTLVAQADGNVWANSLPLAQWPPNSAINDNRTITLETPLTTPTIRIGLYNWMTGERIPLETAAGTPVPDDAFTLSPKTP